eukprot:SM000063S20062  [mRNA]  locus=s63:547279:550585:- [translate_table: standard]
MAASAAARDLALVRHSDQALGCAHRRRSAAEPQAVEYDATAAVLRVRGKNVAENEHVRARKVLPAAFGFTRLVHTTRWSWTYTALFRSPSLATTASLTRAALLLLLLLQDCWDAVALDTLRLASDPAASSDVAAVLMQEGLAILCLLGGSVTTDKARVEVSIPRKRGGGLAGYDKVTYDSCLPCTIHQGDKIGRALVSLAAVSVVSAPPLLAHVTLTLCLSLRTAALACQAMNRFFEQTLQAVLRHVDFGIVRCLILASPGFTKDQFYEFLMIEATRRELRAIIENKNRIILAHSSSGYKHSLKEVLAEPAVLAQVKDTKAAKEVKALQDFYSMLTSDPARAFYGPGHVEAAHERLAIQTLLITDELFRNANLTERRRWVNLVEAVKADGGHIHVFSSMHVSGEQLRQLTGVAAILRFPLPDLEDMEL